MNSIDILNAIGDVDDEYLTKAKAKKTPRKKLWITLGSSLAACLALVFAVPLIFGMTMRAGTAADPEASRASDSESDITFQAFKRYRYADVDIYYVDGDKLCTTTQYLRCVAEDVFTVWREVNGIGDEVKLVKCEINDNSTTAERVMPNGEKVMEHTPGDYFIMNLTISSNIEDYYDRHNYELLLDSLKQTMTGYSDTEFDEYHLILEPIAEKSMSSVEYISKKFAERDPGYYYGDAKIFYVADGKICSKTQPMYYKSEDIFTAWREANGIGDEVKFVKCEIEDNGTETERVLSNGETIIEITMGDYFILNLTISKNIENYYDRIDSELLLGSLERTMKDYDEDNFFGGGIEYDEYHLILV